MPFWDITLKCGKKETILWRTQSPSLLCVLQLLCSVFFPFPFFHVSYISSYHLIWSWQKKQQKKNTNKNKKWSDFCHLLLLWNNCLQQGKRKKMPAREFIGRGVFLNLSSTLDKKKLLPIKVPALHSRFMEPKIKRF